MKDNSLSPTNVLALDQQMCFPFYTAANLLQQLYRPLLAPLRLTYAQYLVMLVLWNHHEDAGVTIGHIGAQLGFETGTLSPLLKRMEVLGHIRRTRDPEDERCVRITLAPEGRTLKDAAKTIPTRLLQDAPIPKEELRALREGAKHFTACLRMMLHKHAL